MKTALLFLLLFPLSLAAQSPALDSLSRYILLTNGLLIKADLYEETTGEYQQIFTHANGGEIAFDRVRFFKNSQGIHQVINPANRLQGVYTDYARLIRGGHCSLYENKAASSTGSVSSSTFYSINNGTLRYFMYENLKVDLSYDPAMKQKYDKSIMKQLEKARRWETTGDPGGLFLGAVSMAGGGIIIAANANYDEYTDTTTYEPGALLGLLVGVVGLLISSASSQSITKAKRHYQKAVQTYNAMF